MPLKHPLQETAAAAKGLASKQARLDGRENETLVPVSFRHPRHDVDPFHGRGFNIHHPLIMEAQATLLYKFCPYALNKL